MERVAQSCVGVHGQGINGLSRGRDLSHIFRYRPGVEVLIRIGTKGLPASSEMKKRSSHAWP